MHLPDWQTTAPIIFASATLCLSFLVSLALSPIFSRRCVESFAVVFRIFFLTFLGFCAVAGLSVPGWYSMEISGYMILDPQSVNRQGQVANTARFTIDFSLWGFHMETLLLSDDFDSDGDGSILDLRNTSQPASWRSLHDCTLKWAYGPIGAYFLDDEYENALKRQDPIPVLCILQYLTSYGVKYLSAPPPVSYFKTAAIWSAITLSLALASLLLSVIFLHSILRYGAIWLFLCGIFFLTTIAIQYVLIVNQPVASNLLQSCSRFVVDNHSVSDFTLESGWVLILCIVAGASATLVSFVLFVIDLRVPQLAARFFAVDVASQPVDSIADSPVSTNVNQNIRSDNIEMADHPASSNVRPASVARKQSIFNRLQVPRRGPAPNARTDLPSSFRVEDSSSPEGYENDGYLRREASITEN